MQARDAKGILLTATPYANSADDIKNQIMLFHSSSETTIPPAEGNLEKFFRHVKNGEADLVDLLRNIKENCFLHFFFILYNHLKKYFILHR